MRKNSIVQKWSFSLVSLNLCKLEKAVIELCKLHLGHPSMSVSNALLKLKSA